MKKSKIENREIYLSKIFGYDNIGYLTPQKVNLPIITTTNCMEHKNIKKICNTDNLIIEGGYNSFLLDNYYKVKNIFFHNCEKNFTYYNLHLSMFPNLENVIITNDPCERDLLLHFSEKNVNVYLNEYFYNNYCNYYEWNKGIEEHIFYYNEDDYQLWFDKVKKNEDIFE